VFFVVLKFSLQLLFLFSLYVAVRAAVPILVNLRKLVNGTTWLQFCSFMYTDNVNKTFILKK
jgi:hypothetical protein